VPMFAATRLIGPEGLTERETSQAAALFYELVADGAALGWTEPPTVPEVRDLLAAVTAGVAAGDAALAFAVTGNDQVAGLGYWRRYDRPTHRVNADLEKLAVSPAAQGQGVGRALLSALITAARTRRIETLTLDLRGDNVRAAALYESAGFTRYGTLPGFVAVGDRRYDKFLYAVDLRATT
jgi:ribosomal protein S18 acetylase RimI-like enzyme